MYRIQLQRDEKIKHRDLANQHIARLKFFNLLLKSTIKNSKRQAENYLNLAKEIEKEPHEIHLVTLNIFRDIQRIQQMDSEEVFRAYLSVFSETDMAIREYKEIYAMVDFIGEKLKQRETAQEKHIMFTHENQKQVKELIDGLAEETRSILFSIRGNLPPEIIYENQPLVIDFSKLLDCYFYLINTQGGLFSFELAFSEPLRNLIVEKYPNQDFSNSLLLKSLQAASNLKHIEFNSMAYSKDAAALKEELSDSLNKLECSIKMIDRAIENYYQKDTK